MNTNDEELEKMLDLIYPIESNTSDDNAPRIESVKSLFKQLKEENDLLRSQKEDLQKDKEAWETQAQKTAEQYHKLEAAKKRLELKLKTTDADIPIKINDAPLEELSESDEHESRKNRRKKDKKVEVSWMIEHAQNEVRTIDDAKAIKDMLMYYFLNVFKSPNADIIELLKMIERIPYEYDKNHPKQPIVHTAAQVVVSNNGKVEYHNKKKNGKHGK